MPSSSMRSPCSMLVMPARRAFLMPAVPSACAKVPWMPAALRLLDDGPHLFDCELRRVRRVRRGPHAARGHDLDPVGARPDLEPGGTSDRVRPVGDARRQVAHLRPDDRAGGGPPVVVATGLRQRLAADLRPGTGKGARCEGALDPRGGPARVADGGHAAFEEFPPCLETAHHYVRRRALDPVVDRLEAQGQVEMAVDDAGQDGESGRVDPLGVSGDDGGLRGTGSHDPPVVVGHDHAVRDRIRRATVQQACADEDGWADRREHWRNLRAIDGAFERLTGAARAGWRRAHGPGACAQGLGTRRGSAARRPRPSRFAGVGGRGGTRLRHQPESQGVARPVRIVGGPLLDDFTLAVGLADRPVRVKDELAAFGQSDLARLEPPTRCDRPLALAVGRH